MMRRLVTFATLSAFAVVLFMTLVKLPAFGSPLGSLADVYAGATVPDFHITNVVTAISFGYRGFDTMLEEFIFFTCITSVSILLRNTLDSHDEKTAARKGGRAVERSDAVNLVGIAWIGMIVALAVSLIAHAHLTPGGGFQGGAILGTALLTVYLVTSREAFERISPDLLVKIADSAGAGLFVVIGFLGLIFGSSFLGNFLPLGRTHDLISGGTILLVNLAVAIEVSAGYALLFKEYLREVHDAESAGKAASTEG